MVEVEPEQIGFPHARTLIRVSRTAWRTKDGAQTTGARVFLSSLSLQQIGDGKRLLQSIRNHWSVENSNHWKRDANWCEDKSRLRSAPVARTLALLRGALLPFIKGNAQQFFLDCSRRPANALRALESTSVILN